MATKGIPAFVFKNQLPAKERPTADDKALEVVLYWHETVLSVAHYAKNQPVVIGTDNSCDFQVSSAGMPGQRFDLVRVADGQLAVHWADTMHVEVRNEAGYIRDETHLESKENGSRFVLGLNDRVAVQVGELTFVLQYVKSAQQLKPSLLKTMDYYFTKVLGLTFIGHVFLVLMMLLTPQDPDGLSEDLLKNPNRFAQLILKQPEKKKIPKKIELSGAKGGGKHKDKEGKFGKPDTNKPDAMASKKGAPRVDPNKREKDRKIAMQSGLFKALSGTSASAVSNVFGPGGLGTGINNMLGGLRGSAPGESGGNGGLGSRGTGPGGGGNSMGIGGIGNGSGYGTNGQGNVDLGGSGKAKYTIVPSHTVTKGCLTQEQVLRVVNRVQSQAKYCYEKELTRNPNLSGKVTTSFVIDATGSVISSSVTESTMNSPEVEACLTRVVTRLKFSPCLGGGTAEVTYPWIFKSGGN